MSETSVTWVDVEPWFEDLDDQFALGITPPQLHSNPPFSAWKLALTIRSQAYVERGEAGEADGTITGLPNRTICPRELATRLRELLDIIQTASVSSNRQLWNEIVSHEWGSLDKSWDTVDQSLPCHQKHFWLCFNCEMSRDHIKWLTIFVDEFFRPMNELATLPEFREIMSKMNYYPVHSQFEDLTHCQDTNVQWSRHIRIWMMDTTSMPRDSAGVVDLVKWMSKTCALFRWQLGNVLQFEHYPIIQHQTCVHAHHVPVSTVVLGVISQTFYLKRSSGFLMDGSLSSSIKFHRTNWSEVYASYCWTPANADVTNRSFLLYVDGVTSAKDKGAILPRLYELLMHNSTLLTVPAISDDVMVVSRASLAVLFAILTACSNQNDPHVDVIVCSNEDSWFELEAVSVGFPLDGSEAEGTTKLRLRFEDDEDSEEPLEIFLMRLIGPSLRHYTLSAITSGLEAVFYEAMHRHCPNLESPAIGHGPVAVKLFRLREPKLPWLRASEEVHIHALHAIYELLVLHQLNVVQSAYERLIVARSTLVALLEVFKQLRVHDLGVALSMSSYDGLKFSFTFKSSKIGAGDCILELDLLRVVDDSENDDEPLETFVMRLIGPYLREYRFSFIPPGYESVFYETMTVYCPNLKKLMHEHPMVSFGEMVATSKRLKIWNIQHLGITINDEAPIDIFLDALCDLSHPMSRMLSYVEVGVKVKVFSPIRDGDTSARILQIFQAIPRIHFPCNFHFDMLPQLRAIIHDPFEELSASGAFEYIAPLDSSCRFAILGVLFAREITIEQGIMEEILAFAATRTQHEVTFSPRSESRLRILVEERRNAMRSRRPLS